MKRFWRWFHHAGPFRRADSESPRVLLEIVITGYDNGQIDWDTMSFHGNHSTDDMRALLIALVRILPPATPENVRTLTPPVPSSPPLPEGVAA